MLNLNPIEARVLGSLIEKEATTPEYYPLSLNALVNACNQKSSRDPVMELGETDVRTALFALEELGLVRVVNDARATKFEHLAYHKLNLRRPEMAVVGFLLLRGPQTAAELRTRAERLYSFEDTTAVTETLERLAAREDSLVAQRSREPGSREARWAHRLGGGPSSMPIEQVQNLKERSDPTFEHRFANLERLVQAMNARIQAVEDGNERG